MVFAEISLKDAQMRATKSLRAASSCYVSLSSFDREMVTYFMSGAQEFYNDAIKHLNMSKSSNDAKYYYEQLAGTYFIYSDSQSLLALRQGKVQAKQARDSGRKGGASCL